MRWVAVVVLGFLLGLCPAQAQQLQSCLQQTDVFTVIVHSGSATLNTATFNFDDLTGTITFKGSTPLRIFFNTTQSAIAQFQFATNPDAYFSTFSRTYHESLLAQSPGQACPLMTTDSAYLQTH